MTLRQTASRLHLANLNSPRWLAMAAILAYGLFFLTHLARLHFDVSMFIVAGDKYVNRAEAPAGLDIRTQSDGYDGQFYYRLALDPLTREQTADGITFDHAAYRQQRIVFPALAWIFSLGNSGAIPVVFVVINLAALGVIGWLAGSIARHFGQHAMWGMVIVLYPGFLISLSRDLTEILSTMWLLAGLLAWEKKRNVVSAGLLTLAVLTRESSLIAIAALGIMTIVHWHRAGRFIVSAWYPVLIPCMCYAIWFTYLAMTWHVWPTSGNLTTFGLGFQNLGNAVQAALASTRPYDRVVVLDFVLLGFLAAAALARWRRRSAAGMYLLAWGLYAMMALLLTQSWEQDIGFLRALTEFSIFAAIIVMASPGKLKLVAAVAMTLQWLLVATVTSRLNF